jgi:hypothetical protein
MIKLLLSLSITFFILGCSSTKLIAQPYTYDSDAEWIKKYDSELRDKQVQLTNSHNGKFESKVILWQQIDCKRRVLLSQARAIELMMIESGISFNDAKTKIGSDPTWVIAQNSCR